MPYLQLPIVMDEDDTPEQTFVHGVIAKPGVGMAYVPLVSLMSPMPLEIKCAHLLTDADLVWQVRLGGELGGAAWDFADGTQVQADNDSVNIQGGRIIYAGLCASTTNAGAETEILEDLKIPAGVTMTLCARRVAGTGGTVSATIVWTGNG